jgi:hypothetical protein
MDRGWQYTEPLHPAMLDGKLAGPETIGLLVGPVVQ